MTATPTYDLTANPIHEDGSIGFEHQNPIMCAAWSLADVFALMADELSAYPEYSAWDLTLTENTHTTPTEGGR